MAREVRLTACFVTLAQSCRAETRDRGSRFIATAFPARDLKEARAAIEALRSEFPDATHHCWAYSFHGIGAGPEERCHDAGEPRGTAGPPILQVIRAAGLRNLVVVVARYFGGTKLGKGGLARAYRAAAAAALARAQIMVDVPSSRVRISVPLSLDGEARHLVVRHGGRVEASSYDDSERSILTVSVPAEARARLHGDLQTLARGKALVQDPDEVI